MRKSFFVFFFLAVSFAVGSANVRAQSFPEGGVYMAFDGGVRVIHLDVGDSEIDDDPDVGYLFGGAVGYDTGKGPRGELAVSYSNNNVSISGTEADFDFGLFTVLGKGYYDLHLDGTSFTPFIGPALGYGRVSASISVPAGRDVTVKVSASDDIFLWGGQVGFRVSLNENISAGLEYSLLGDEDAEFVGGIVGRIQYKF